MKTFLGNVILLAFCLSGLLACAAPKDEAKEVVDIIYKVNNYWQGTESEAWAFFLGQCRLSYR